MENGIRSVAQAMEDVAKWRAEQESKAQAQLGEVDQEIANLNTAIANLQQQLEALSTHREELSTAQAGASDSEGAKIYESIFASLQSQAAALAERAIATNAANAARQAVIDAKLGDAEVKGLVEEYTQFKTTVEPTLAGMPASYRDIISKHHNEVSAKLQAKLADADPGPATVEGDAIGLDVVFGVDAPEGEAEIIMVVLPVSEEVQTSWHTRQEDVQTQLAARAIQAVYQACNSIGFNTAQAMFGGHLGLLAVELELPGGDPAPIQAALQTALDQILGDAAELNAAKIQARGTYALVDHLLPPEEEEEGEEMSNA